MSAPDVQPTGRKTEKEIVRLRGLLASQSADMDGLRAVAEKYLTRATLAESTLAGLRVVVEGLRTQLAKAQADHVAWCEANYTIGRENMRPTLEEFRSRALAAEGQVAAVEALAERQPCDCGAETPVGIEHHARTGGYNEAISAVRAALESRLG